MEPSVLPQAVAYPQIDELCVVPTTIRSCGCQVNSRKKREEMECKFSNKTTRCFLCKDEDVLILAVLQCCATA